METTRPTRERLIDLLDEARSRPDLPSRDFADAILALFPDHARPNECTLGVGDGAGQRFVHGDYVSIKTLQGKLVDHARLLADFRWLARRYGHRENRERHGLPVTDGEWRKHVAPWLAPPEEPR